LLFALLQPKLLLRPRFQLTRLHISTLSTHTASLYTLTTHTTHILHTYLHCFNPNVYCDPLLTTPHTCILPHLITLYTTLLHSYNSYQHFVTYSYLHCFNPNFYCVLASNLHACISPHFQLIQHLYTLLQLIQHIYSTPICIASTPTFTATHCLPLHTLASYPT